MQNNIKLKIIILSYSTYNVSKWRIVDQVRMLNKKGH